MSQASKRHANRPSRLREKLARELAKIELAASIVCGLCQGLGYDLDITPDEVDCKMCEGTGSGRVVLARALLSDPEQGFDVHAAREHARGLIALEAEQVAFEDWTRAQGLGPENREPGAFAPTAEHVAMRIARGQTRGLSKLAPFHRRGGWPGKLARQWGGDPRAPMGRSLARLGQQLLDMLEGQPSECGHWTANDGQTMRTVIIEHVPTVAPCGCQGTGHNLRGVLPAVEVTTQMRRRVADWLDVDGTNESDWLSDFDDGTAVSITTRVVARGQHREYRRDVSLHSTLGRIRLGVKPHPLDVRIQGRAKNALDFTLINGGTGHDAHVRAWAQQRASSSWRGELKHAEQRRAKAAREYTDAVDRMREGEPFML